MGYGRISSTKKGISLVVSVFIHLAIMVVLGLSLQHLPQKSPSKRFDLYAIKLLDLKPMSKDRLTSRGDNKSGKMIRKKKSNKRFAQKGVRQALAPKTPLESLKKTARAPLTETQITPPPKFTLQHRPVNKLDKVAAMASLDPVKRQAEWKLVSNRSNKVSAKLEKSSSSKRYTQRFKSFNRKQITPLKSTSSQYTKAQPQQLVDQLRRTQRFTLPSHSSQVKMNLAQQQALPQGDRKIQLTKLRLNQHQDRINNRINYQQKQLTSEPVVVAQRRVSYNTRSAPVIKKTAIGPNQFLTEVTQTITEVRQVETITQVVKRSTSVSRADSTPVLKNELVLESTSARVMEKQAKVATTTPQKTQALRTVAYQQQTQGKPVELTQARISYQRELQTVNREVSGPSTLDVAAPTQLEVAQPQTLQTMSRQRVSLEPTPRVDEAVLTNDLALEPIPARVMEKQAKVATTTPQKTQALRTVAYQQQTQGKPVELTQARISYQRELQTVNREVSGPSTLDVAAPTQLEVAQPQSLQTMSRQRVSLEPVPQTNEAILSPKSILENISQNEFADKQIQLVKLESSTEKFVVKKRLEFEQRSVAKPTRIIQQRVAYQQASQEVDKKSLDQPTSPIGTVVQLKESAEFLASEAQLATISRQEPTPSVSPSLNNFILETQRYTPQEEPAFAYTKARNRVDLSPQTVEQKRRLAFAYTPQATDKSKVKLDTSHSPSGASVSQMHSGPASPLLSSGQAATGEKDAPVIKTKLPSGNTTNETLYRLKGEIEGDAKQAFVTINEVTQLVQVINGEFEIEIAMIKGINKISILAFDSRGGVGKQTVRLLYNPPPGVPLVRLESPENGKQGVKEGDSLIVSGTIDDRSITQATLYLNGVPIKVKVINGRFKRKVFLPNTRITTFRVMAQNQNGPPGYSALHTILAGYDIDIINPRPY